MAASLALVGQCDVVMINYRGSTGFGELSLLSLPGKVGRQDVDDCMAALDAVLDKSTSSDRKVAVYGGSHGGFLAAHLLGQFPNRFQCGILRNPVTNISSMVGVTDIPDWCYVETFGTIDGISRYTAAPTVEDMMMMFNASPVAHVHKYRAPSLFLLGEKDQRVPMSNPIQFIAKLKAQGVTTKVYRFPNDCHPLSRPQTEFLCANESIEWILKYCSSQVSV